MGWWGDRYRELGSIPMSLSYTRVYTDTTITAQSHKVRPVRCEYCGSGLMYHDRNCPRCGAPRYE